MGPENFQVCSLMQTLQRLHTAHQAVGKETGGEGARAMSCEVQDEVLEGTMHICKALMLYFDALVKNHTIILVKFPESTIFSLPPVTCL